MTEERKVYSATARHGKMSSLGEFRTSMSDLRPKELVLLRTERGMEVGQIVEGSEERSDDVKFLGTILRRLNDQDSERIRAIANELEPEEFQFCAAKLKELSLPMKLVEVEHLFGGDKIIFYFVADGRVDFRQLVKELASKYKTRIEMRQIGVRDEARLLGSVEHCGQELCCRAFLKELEAVNMRMAKMQKTTLDPTKISGRCGRLMCCLRYEDEIYTDLASRLPSRGKRVKTPRCQGTVLSHDILQQTVKIKTDEGAEVIVKAAEILQE